MGTDCNLKNENISLLLNGFKKSGTNLANFHSFIFKSFFILTFLGTGQAIKLWSMKVFSESKAFRGVCDLASLSRPFNSCANRYENLFGLTTSLRKGLQSNFGVP